MHPHTHTHTYTNIHKLIYIYIYIYIYIRGGNPRATIINFSAQCQRLYRRIINLKLKIHQHSTCRTKKSFYSKIKRKNPFFCVIINLFLVVMTIIRRSRIIFLFGCSYIAPGENGIFIKRFIYTNIYICIREREREREREKEKEREMDLSERLPVNNENSKSGKRLIHAFSRIIYKHSKRREITPLMCFLFSLTKLQSIHFFCHLN